jgi:Methyltransferase domain
VSEFLEFVLQRLPAAPARVLEVGCGVEGGLTPALADAGYDVLGIDPDAPEGPLFRSVTLEELDDPGRFAAVVASRVLHHVEPLGPGLDKLARLAPLLLVDEFAPERIDEPTREWYETQHRRLVAAAGAEPLGPSDLREWAARHPDLHPSHVVLGGLEARFETQHLERRPYLYRWLGDLASEELERSLIDAGAIRAVGFRYAGVRTETTRPSDAPR